MVDLTTENSKVQKLFKGLGWVYFTHQGKFNFQVHFKQAIYCIFNRRLLPSADNLLNSLDTD